MSTHVNRAVNYREYLRSDRWKATRLWALERAHYQCEMCGARAVNVHHLTYARLGHEHPNDLVSLCRPCHQEEHGLAPERTPEATDLRTIDGRHAANTAAMKQRLVDLARGYEEWVVDGRTVHRPAPPAHPYELQCIHQALGLPLEATAE